MSAIAFIVSPVSPRVALDGEAAFDVSVDGMICYLLLSGFFNRIFAICIEQVYQK
jgi:hypothetical protein